MVWGPSGLRRLLFEAGCRDFFVAHLSEGLAIRPIWCRAPWWLCCMGFCPVTSRRAGGAGSGAGVDLARGCGALAPGRGEKAGAQAAGDTPCRYRDVTAGHESAQEMAALRRTMRHCCRWYSRLKVLMSHLISSEMPSCGEQTGRSCSGSMRCVRRYPRRQDQPGELGGDVSWI